MFPKTPVTHYGFTFQFLDLNHHESGGIGLLLPERLIPQFRSVTFCGCDMDVSGDNLRAFSRVFIQNPPTHSHFTSTKWVLRIAIPIKVLS